MSQPKCICGHPESWHDGSDTQYRVDPVKFAHIRKGMCVMRQCTICTDTGFKPKP